MQIIRRAVVYSLLLLFVVHLGFQAAQVWESRGKPIQVLWIGLCALDVWILTVLYRLLPKKPAVGVSAAPPVEVAPVPSGDEYGLGPDPFAPMRTVRARWRLTYTDGSGEMTERTVLVDAFGAPMGRTVVRGRCLLRNARRTFRIDRISNCIDEESGEIIGDVRQHLQALYDASPMRVCDDLLSREADLLCVLLYVARADGRVMATERAIFLRTCTVLAPDGGLTPADISDLIGMLETPTRHAFRKAVRGLARRETRPRAIALSAVGQLLRNKKKPGAIELEAYAYMKEVFEGAPPH